MVNRKIIHVDMDCFYAAVEEKYNPKLKGLPMAVGGPPQSRAVICTANYEARKFGVRAAIPSSRAVRLCPQLILIPPHFDLYKKESRHVREIFQRFTDKFQPLSLDEAYLDVSQCSQFHGSATLIAKEIRRQIFHETGLTASAGIAPNKFLAKIASDWNKPNGQFVIRPEEIENFVRTLPIEKLWGVGKVTAEKMHAMGLHTCEDIQKLSLIELKRRFGASRALELFQLSRGQDEREVHVDQERKSLSVEETFSRDLQSLDEILQALPSIFEDWKKRLQRSEDESRIRGAVIKMKYMDFKSCTHEESLRHCPTLEDFQRLIIAAWQRRSDPIRLLGVGVRLASQADSSEQLRFDVLDEVC
ncbi:MAG: DNA polymerase IV [Pseudobdellovibrionaceae bacterium]